MINMYDLSNEQDYYYIHGKCIANLPINFYGLNIKQISLKDYFNYGEEWFARLVYPFRLNKKILLKEQDLIDNIGILELFDLVSEEQRKNKSNEIIEDILIENLKYLFTTNNVKKMIINKHNVPFVNYIVDDTLMINSEKFEELKKIILVICGEIDELDLSKLNSKKTIKLKNKKDQAAYNKLLEGRKKRAEKNKDDKSVKLFNIYRAVVYMQENIDFELWLNRNIYQLYDTFKNLHEREGYRERIRIATSGFCSSKDLDLKPLSQKIVK